MQVSYDLGNLALVNEILLSENIPSLESSINRKEQEDNVVLHLISVLTCICDGYAVGCLTEHVCVCLLTKTAYTKGNFPHGTVQVYSHSDSSVLASSTLDPNTFQHVYCKSSSTIMQPRSSVSMSRHCSPHKTRETELCCKDVGDRQRNFLEKLEQNSSLCTKTRKNYSFKILIISLMACFTTN
jgi:hypothetical protein